MRELRCCAAELTRRRSRQGLLCTAYGVFRCDDDHDNRARRDFGPVLAIMPYDSEDEAVIIANDTVYGLSGGVWSGDKTHAEQVARRLRTGQVAINGADFNPIAPFGGYKQSGIGRELGTFGLQEFLEVKALQR